MNNWVIQSYEENISVAFSTTSTLQLESSYSLSTQEEGGRKITTLYEGSKSFPWRFPAVLFLISIVRIILFVTPSSSGDSKASIWLLQSLEWRWQDKSRLGMGGELANYFCLVLKFCLTLFCSSFLMWYNIHSLSNLLYNPLPNVTSSPNHTHTWTLSSISTYSHTSKQTTLSKSCTY